MSERERRWRQKIAVLTPEQTAQVLARLITLLDRTERTVRTLRREEYSDTERRAKLDKIAFVLRKKMRTVWDTSAMWTSYQESWPS